MRASTPKLMSPALMVRTLLMQASLVKSCGPRVDIGGGESGAHACPPPRAEAQPPGRTGPPRRPRARAAQCRAGRESPHLRRAAGRAQRALAAIVQPAAAAARRAVHGRHEVGIVDVIPNTSARWSATRGLSCARACTRRRRPRHARGISQGHAPVCAAAQPRRRPARRPAHGRERRAPEQGATSPTQDHPKGRSSPAGRAASPGGSAGDSHCCAARPT